MSGVGKGVTVSSIGKILSARGFKLSLMKIDPYLNVDAGTMSPIEHGEVFVLDSGLECDQDMGNYERFLGESVPPENYMTSGMVYKYVIDKERALGYGGKCVDPVPYISEEILRRIKRATDKSKADISVIEIGGTAGEYQNTIFLEAARILKLRSVDDVIFVLVSYLPVPGKVGEMKTKPTQYAVRTLNSYGIHPDIIIARSDRPIDDRRKEKLAFASNVRAKHIISAPDVDDIYEIPINFEKDGLSETLLDLLKLKPKQRDLKDWRAMVERRRSAKAVVKIGIIGKYFKTGDYVLSDVYISVIEALKHSATALGHRLELKWLDSADYEESPEKVGDLAEYDGVLVPGGFGTRGVEGKIRAIKYARENRLPYLGLCYGMQLAVVEYARTVLGWPDAHTVEINPATKHPVIDIMPEQKKNLETGNYGATMRLGAYPCKLKPGTIAFESYNPPAPPSGRQATKAIIYKLIKERHRHRYEVNPTYVAKFEESGMMFSGRSPDGRLMEIVELAREVHPYFVGTQFHPEFKSRPLTPHPLFLTFVKASIEQSENKTKLSKN